MSVIYTTTLTSKIEDAISHLNSGEVVAVPTETVYGLAANAYDDDAVSRIYRAKGRPSANPLICHFANAAAVWREVVITNKEITEKLCESFWPGPLTIIFPRKESSQISHLATCGLNTVAVRVPAHPTIGTMLSRLSFPVAAPSANVSGELTCVDSKQVLENLNGRIPLILEGGRTARGLESTVIDLSSDRPSILRHGVITKDDLESVADLEFEDLTRVESHNPSSPGLMYRHYAPSKPLRINANDPEENEILIVFGRKANGDEIQLSERGNLAEAAANLFYSIYLAEKSNKKAIAVMPIPEIGVGVAINDRLRRACDSKTTSIKGE